MPPLLLSSSKSRLRSSSISSTASSTSWNPLEDFGLSTEDAWDLEAVQESAIKTMNDLLALTEVNTSLRVRIVELEEELRRCKADSSAKNKQIVKMLHQRTEGVPYAKVFQETLNSINLLLVINNNGTC